MTSGDLELEGRPFPFSRRPLALTGDEWAALTDFAEGVWDATQAAVNRIVDGVTERPAWLADRYGPLLDQALRRGLYTGEIPIMRLDLAWTGDGEPRVLEFNTACPGGFLFTPRVAEKMGADSYGRSVAPARTRFAEFLMRELGERVAIVTWGSDYAFELDTLAGEIQELGGDAIITDPLRDGGAAMADYRPTGLYWKSDPLRLLLDPDAVARTVGDLPSFSPFDAMTFVEDKSFVAHVSETSVTPVGPASIEVTGRSVAELLAWRSRESAVLKPTNLTRGEGIVVGALCGDADWAGAVDAAVRSGTPWLLQDRLQLRHDPEAGLFGDLSVFLLGGEVVGAMARKSTERVINIGRTGMLQSVVIADDDSAAVERIRLSW
ncbi:hypothetical protein F0L68_10020 [Solihabitans fulvus]|uniref:Uncharacterized protein n=1 Tax=Solihabitans fulvus TaxID=1892852 RepID=A0A5B2XJI4_9PSEU|nr:hypothetical protein [Solihabitans fulvus]KAA2263364.1 hypothetical protein F0L68_10020 [Solihabitans fulvus]